MSDATKPSEHDVRELVAQEFHEMQEALAAANPGVMELLRVYGDYDTALRQATNYLNMLSPVPRFCTTDSSG